jgi:hypothetical protein
MLWWAGLLSGEVHLKYDEKATMSAGFPWGREPEGSQKMGVDGYRQWIENRLQQLGR